MFKHATLIEELGVIDGAISAARILAEALASNQLGPSKDHRAAPRAVAAALAIAGDRVRDLSCSIREQHEATHVTARHARRSRKLR